MASSHTSDIENKDGFSEASLFEAISHDSRIRALFVLRGEPLSFSELKRKLGISSSGNLQHHISKLATLIHQTDDGMYALTDQGQEAIMAIQSIRKLQDRDKSNTIAMTLIYSFSLYIGFMNMPFIMGSVSPTTPVLALGISVIAGIIFYLGWTIINSRRAKRPTS